MARPYRLKFENACYLVTLQGVDGLGLFVEKEDALHFQQLLSLIALKHQILLHAYALSENGAALVLETPKANLSLYLQGVQTAYARHIRQNYVQSGPIMRDRYRAKVLEKATTLASACEWVHTFPVREIAVKKTPAAKRKFLDTYRFSSYLYTVGKVEEGITQPEQLLRTYGSPAKNRPQAHQHACEQLLVEGTEAWDQKAKQSTVAIGTPDFVKEMNTKHQAVLSGKRVKGFRQYGKKKQGISRNKVVESVAKTFGVNKQTFFAQQHSSILRPVLSSFLYQYAAMTQKEIADYLGLGSAAAVSLQIKRLLQLRSTDVELNKKCVKLEKSFARK